MSDGRLIAVVGPSGVGKDSIIAGIIAASPQIIPVRRVITRAPDLGGEDYDPVSEPEFLTAIGQNEFCVHWTAHGLHYGIPSRVQRDVENGSDCLVNLSRSTLIDASQKFQHLTVLNITAKPETLVRRLSQRGRETANEITQRLLVAEKPIPTGLDVIEIPNDGPLECAVNSALNALQPRRG